MNLASPPKGYDQGDQARTRAEIQLADAGNLKRGRDIEVGKGRLILTDTDGGRWVVTVSNTGTLSATAL